MGSEMCIRDRSDTVPLDSVVYTFATLNKRAKTVPSNILRHVEDVILNNNSDEDEDEDEDDGDEEDSSTDDDIYNDNATRSKRRRMH